MRPGPPAHAAVPKETIFPIQKIPPDGGIYNTIKPPTTTKDDENKTTQKY